MLVEFFQHLITRTYNYELVNTDQTGRESVFGLLRNDLSEKLPFEAVNSLIAILSDKGADFKLRLLNYVLDDSVNNIQQILFEKRDGNF